MSARIGGFAPGSYMCRCYKCTQHFVGDKRAIECLNCALPAALAAGYRILAPGELDAATIEACAKLAESLPDQRGNSPEHLVGVRIATALRNMRGTNG